MIALYLTSMDEAAGKSALCAALGSDFKAEGRKVGFFKPVSILPGKADSHAVDKDTEFIKQLLSLQEPVELLCPVSLAATDFTASANEKDPAWLKKVREAYVKISQGKDVVLIEGVSGVKAGSIPALAAIRTLEALDARAILIISYRNDLEASQIVSAARALAGRLLGVVINAVPQRRLESVKANLVPTLEKNGIKVVGVLPEDRILLAVSVGELAQHLGGTILNSPEHSEDLVESVMVGAMSPDPAVSYLSLKQNKAVLTRGDRPDIQLAALVTSTRCLILAGNISPLPNVLNRALEVKVPIVLVKDDTTHIMEALEEASGKASFAHMKKVERLGQLLEQHLDLKFIYQLV